MFPKVGAPSTLRFHEIFFTGLTSGESKWRLLEIATGEVGDDRRLKFLVDVSDIFYFFCSGRGKGGGVEVPEGGGGSVFLLKSPGGGGLQDGRGRGAGRVFAANWEILGGGGRG